MEDSDFEKHLKLDSMICFALYGATHAFTRAYKPLLEPLGLTYPQYLVMIALWEKGSAPVKELGDMLGLDSGTLSPLLKRLEQAGLVTRTRSAVDERQVLAGLTDKGAEMKKQAAGVMRSIADTTGCSLEEITSLRDSINALRDSLAKAAE